MRTVLVGTDGSEMAEGAVRWAALDAAADSATLVIVASWTVPVVPYPEGMWAGEVNVFRDGATEAASAAREIALGLGVTSANIDVRVVEGRAERILADSSGEADLVVVGSRGLGTVSGALLGSVSHHLVHHTDGPVIVVPGDEDSAGVQVPPRRILVGLDGSEGSRAGLLDAVKIARRHGASVTALTSWHGWEPVTAQSRSLAESDIDDWAKQWMRDLVDEEVGEDSRGTVDLVSSGLDPVEALLSTECDLVVVGSRGRGGFAELVLGSVARKVAYQARRPTLVHRSDT